MSESYLLQNCLLFGRLLRSLGLEVNPDRMLDLVKALEQIDIGNRQDFYFTARSLLVHRHEDYPLFDQAFEAFWRKPSSRWQRADLRALLEEKVRPPKWSSDGFEQDAETEGEPVVQARLRYSRRELLRDKDFAELTPEELAQIEAWISQITWSLGERRSRRWEAGDGYRYNLRSTLRHNLKYGGEFVTWKWRKPKVTPRPLIVLADVSGSMETYSRVLLHFIYSLSKSSGQPVESFVFSTRLTRITKQLHDKPPKEALASVAREVKDWSGGTRIGEAIKAFNFDWARRLQAHRAVVLLISDGWDRGEPELLKAEIQRLQRNSHRLIWLNPLLGSPEYEPLTQGLQAALPHVDDFLPVHNLNSLESLGAELKKTSSFRPTRRQQVGQRIH